MTIAALLISDIHLREDTPICRIDNYWEAQERKVRHISQLQDKYDVPLIVGGDLFDTWKTSPYLMQWAICNLERIIAIPGQHDLPQHSLKLFQKCGMAVLEAAGLVTVLGVGPRNSAFNAGEFDVVGFPWGVKPGSLNRRISGRRQIAVIHTLTYLGDPLWPGMVADDGLTLLRKLDQFDLILTGDNHKQFIVEEDGRILLNPGSMMRATADQVDHRPAVFGWHIETNTLERFDLPIESDVVSREHLELHEQRDARMDAFVSRLKTDYEIGFSFEQNLNVYFNKNRTRSKVKDLVWAMLEEKEA